MKFMQVAVAQIGARRHYAIPAMLRQAGLLESLSTDLCSEWPPLRVVDSIVPKAIQPRGLKRLLGRRVADVPARQIRCFPSFAARRILAARKDRSADDRYRSWLKANKEFGELVVARGFGNADTVYTFNGAALEILQAGRRRGLRTVVEQTAAPVEAEERMLAEERERWPAWESEGASITAWQPLADRERAEWDLADVILCGSEYVIDELSAVGGPASRAAVVPYACPPEMLVDREPRADDGELHVLFAGTICLRKGLPYVLEATRRAQSQRIRIRAVGPIRVSDAAAGELRREIELIGPVPRSEMRRQYAWADVFLMPSISEGSANVCYEALGSSLPVITTHNSGSVVRDGSEGFIVQIRDAEAIAARIEELASNRKLRREMSVRARERAEEFGWDGYAERLLSVIGAGSDTKKRVPVDEVAY